MSDDESSIDQKAFSIEVAKQGRAVCKKCKAKCLQGEIRFAKLLPNPFGEGLMKGWHHVDCLFEVLLKQRPTTKRIESPEDIDGWDNISSEDQDVIGEKIKVYNEEFSKKHGIKLQKTPVKKPSKNKSPKVDKLQTDVDKRLTNSKVLSNSNDGDGSSRKPLKDNLFKEFRKLIANITNNSAYTDKTNCVKQVFGKGSDGNGFKGDVVLWCRLLLPGVVKRVYNLQSKQLVKLFSRIFRADQDEMLEHLEQGDIGETIQEFFESSSKLKPVKSSNLTVQDVDKFLEKLSQLTKEDDQIEHFESFAKKCTSNDLKLTIRLIKGDLRMGAGAKHILEGLHPDAYEAYQASRDLETVITKCLSNESNIGNLKKTVEAEIKLMTPVLPMLAEACKSIEQAMKKCPNGMYSEIKYDGERVQVHKCHSEFKYYSRSLKPVMSHKIQHFKDYIPKAFPHAKDLILDSEILMIDTITGKPLPFGSLGAHKKAEFKDANVCLFVFDCIYFNGESLIQKPLSYRKKILQENMKEIPNRIMFSEMEKIDKPQDLANMIAKILKLGLEGLVLKDVKSIYEPGKRHWLKVKKDYLFEGAMADTADLIVLGAWYGTGKKGGMMSVFLMGCYNPQSRRFCTVTKVHTGHDDKTLKKLQDELEMEKISQDASKVPKWLNCTKTMVPDFVAKDPKKQPIWEITGAEFTQHDVHTADGISIRFPRVTKIRNDKDWETATNLLELQQLYKNSKENTDVSLLMKNLESNYAENKDDSPVKKKKGDSKSPQKQRGKHKDIIEEEPFVDAECDMESETSKESKDEVPTKKRKKNTKQDSDEINSDEEENKQIITSNIESSPQKRMRKKLEEKKYNVEEESDSKKAKKLKRSDKKQHHRDSDCEQEDEKNNFISKKECLDMEIIDPLPDYFVKVKALIEDELKKDEHSELIRHFIAYGGIILDPECWIEATHVLHYFNFIKEPVIKSPYTAKHVSIEWVKDSITEKILQDFRLYTVQWDPDM